MKAENFEIRHQKHFKLYVLLKDKILFENKLDERGVKYYCDLDEQPFIDGGIRYFLLDSDAIIIDEILIENEIIATNETALFVDNRDEKKVLKKYFMVAIVVTIIMILIVMYDKIF